jgi:hypothetical protein
MSCPNPQKSSRRGQTGCAIFISCRPAQCSGAGPQTYRVGVFWKDIRKVRSEKISGRDPETQSALLVELLRSTQVQRVTADAVSYSIARHIPQRAIFPSVSHSKQQTAVPLHENILRRVTRNGRRSSRRGQELVGKIVRSFWCWRRRWTFLYRTGLSFAAALHEHAGRQQKSAKSKSIAKTPKPAVETSTADRGQVWIVKAQPGDIVKARRKQRQIRQSRHNVDLVRGGASGGRPINSPGCRSYTRSSSNPGRGMRRWGRSHMGCRNGGRSSSRRCGHHPACMLRGSKRRENQSKTSGDPDSAHRAPPQPDWGLPMNDAPAAA